MDIVPNEDITEIRMLAHELLEESLPTVLHAIIGLALTEEDPCPVSECQGRSGGGECIGMTSGEGGIHCLSTTEHVVSMVFNAALAIRREGDDTPEDLLAYACLQLAEGALGASGIIGENTDMLNQMDEVLRFMEVAHQEDAAKSGIGGFISKLKLKWADTRAAKRAAKVLSDT